MSKPDPCQSRIRLAKKEYRCTEASWHTIKPGDLYLYCQSPPWHEMNDGRKWRIIKACLRCANEYSLHTSNTRAQLDRLTTEAEPAAEVFETLEEQIPF